jgi:hypothetical protein
MYCESVFVVKMLCPNHRYNGSYVNIYADELLKRFEFIILLYNKAVGFEILKNLCIEHFLIQKYFNVQIVGTTDYM